MRGWERLASWVAAGQLGVIAEFARRRPRDYVERGARAGMRIGVIRGCRRSASTRSMRSPRRCGCPARPPVAGCSWRWSWPGGCPAPPPRWRDGVIDVPKARAIVEAVTPLDDRLAAAVEARVLPAAGRRTVGQLRAALAQAVLSVDPAAAEDRHTRATAGREVTIRPLADGMAGLWALLPADAATAVYTHLDRTARAAPAADPRGMDARRADALVAAVLHGHSAAACRCHAGRRRGR